MQPSQLPVLRDELPPGAADVRPVPHSLTEPPAGCLDTPGALLALHLGPSHWGAGPGSLLGWVSWVARDQGIQKSRADKALAHHSPYEVSWGIWGSCSPERPGCSLRSLQPLLPLARLSRDLPLLPRADPSGNYPEDGPHPSGLTLPYPERWKGTAQETRP